jgi:hypothetical protein
MSDPLLIERYLSCSQRMALDEQCALMGIPRDKWHEVPMLRQLYETMAVLILAAEKKADRQFIRTERFSRRLAADELGVDPDTLGRRLRRSLALVTGQIVRRVS